MDRRSPCPPPWPPERERRDLSHCEEPTAEQRAAALRCAKLSVWVNLALCVSQVIFGALAGSSALMADGFHSLTDLLSDFIALFVSAHSHKGADKEHPYGHRRFENAASLALGGLVLLAGAGMLASAAFKLQSSGSALAPGPLAWGALAVALAGVASKEALFRIMLKTAQRARSSMLVANAWHARADAASSVVAAIGVAGAMSGRSWVDPLAALLVGAMVAKMGWGFFWPALQDLVDRAVDEGECAAIEATLLATPGVLGVHALRTRKMGDFAQVDVHLEVDASLTVRQGHDIAALARARTLQRHRVLDVMTHVDPVDPPMERPEREG